VKNFDSCGLPCTDHCRFEKKYYGSSLLESLDVKMHLAELTNLRENFKEETENLFYEVEKIKL